MLLKQFYRSFGVKKFVEFGNPRLKLIRAFVAPKNSLIHMWPDNVSMGPAPNHPLLKATIDKLYVRHVTELTAEEGKPVKRTMDTNTMAVSLRRQYPQLRPIVSEKSVLRDKTSLIVVNYGMIPRLYRYIRNFKEPYYQWYNLFSTMIETINENAASNDRTQFIPVMLPPSIPTLRLMKMTEGEIDRRVINLYNGMPSYTIRDIWLYLGDARERSLLNNLSPNAVARTYLVFMDGPYFSVIGLSQLNEWRKAPKEEIDAWIADNGETLTDEQLAYLDSIKSGSKSDIIQKRFIDYLKSIGVARNDASSTTKTEYDENGDVSIVSEIPSSTDEEEEESTSTPPKPVGRIGALDDPIKVIDSTEIDTTVNAGESGTAPKATNTVSSKGIVERANALVEAGAITTGEKKRYTRLADKVNTLPNPFDKSGSLTDLLNIDESVMDDVNTLTIPDIKSVSDKSMLRSRVNNIASAYGDKVLHRHIAQCVTSVSRAGVAVTDYQVERVHDVGNRYDSYTVRFQPVGGEPSTFRFPIPVINKEGNYTLNGSKVKLRPQLGDKPIRKVSPTRVALTTYYSKIMIDRSSKVMFNYSKWLVNQIELGNMDDTNDITELSYGKLKDLSTPLPRVYTSIAGRYFSFTFRDYSFNFNYPHRQELMFTTVERNEEESDSDYTKRATKETAKAFKAMEKDGTVLCGRHKDGRYIVVDALNQFYIGNNQEGLGTIEDVLELDVKRRPTDTAEVKLSGRYIPIVYPLAYYLGITGLMEHLKVNYRTVKRGGRLDLANNEYMVRFADETLIIDRDNPLASLILAGLNQFKAQLTGFNLSDLDDKDIYSILAANDGFNRRLPEELTLMQEMYVDPISEALLKKMGEPTNFRDLLFRSCDLLLTDQFTTEMDKGLMMFRGYERFAGYVYQEIIKGIRQQRRGTISMRKPIDINPHAVLMDIQDDASNILVEEANAVHNTKEKEIFTFVGKGGRTGRTMVKQSRAYDITDLGLISEATVDSGMVSVNVSSSADPNIKNLYGEFTVNDVKDLSPTEIFSTSFLLSPGADYDDTNRINFISIQNSSTIPAEGYELSPYVSGYDKVLAYRTDSKFAFMAKGKGTVTSIKDGILKVKYDDEKLGTDAVEIGKVFGIKSGSRIPHDIVTDLSEGSSFNVGDALAYNKNFFAPAPFEKGKLSWKQGVYGNVAFVEYPPSHEDSCRISKRLSDKMVTKMSNVQVEYVKFDQEIRRLIAETKEVKLGDPLCYIEDPITAQSDLLDEASIQTLSSLSNIVPKAEYNGVIDRIEFIYNGDKEDMSESMRKLIDVYDKQLSRKSKALNGETPPSGHTGQTIRIGGEILGPDVLAIKFYVTETLRESAGDKVVVSHQLKSVPNGVMENDTYTEDGRIVDVFFGYKSPEARQVESCYRLGLMTNLINKLTENVVNMYFNE